MVHPGSNLLPVYTQSSWSYFWRKPDVGTYCKAYFAKVGVVACGRNVCISVYPGQFCVLPSINGNIVERSLDEFKYHADITYYMRIVSTIDH
jgi:UV DNA damage repair endonuclease